jgi:predicted RNA-binding Zn-ribbon protein involved in translation (DUF1610 family)
MGSVVDLAKVRAKRQQPKLVSGPVVCVSCSHDWIAVRKHGETMIECPECGKHSGKSLECVLKDIEVLFGDRVKSVLDRLIELEINPPYGGFGA